MVTYASMYTVSHPCEWLQIPRRGIPLFRTHTHAMYLYVMLLVTILYNTRTLLRASARTCSCVCSYAYLYIIVYTYSVSTIPRIRSYAHFPPVSYGTAFLPLLPSLAQALFHVYCVSTVCRIVPSCYFGRSRTFVAVIQPRFYARKIHFGTYIYLSAYFDRLHVANSLRITTSYIPLRDVFVPQESRTIESLSEGLPIRSS